MQGEEIIMDLAAEQLIEWQLDRLNLRFFDYLDTRNYDALVGTITDDCVIHFTAGSTRGREELRKQTLGWPDFTVRHVVTNLIYSEVTADTARGQGLLTVFSGPGSADGSAVPRFPAEPHLSQVVDWYARTAEGWLIAERRFVNLLLAPSTA